MLKPVDNMIESHTILSRLAIIEKSISGIKWTFVLSPLGVIATYGTTVLLGRLGAEVLGIYGVFLIALTLASTFLFYGGSNVVINFLPL